MKSTVSFVKKVSGAHLASGVISLLMAGIIVLTKNALVDGVENVVFFAQPYLTFLIAFSIIVVTYPLALWSIKNGMELVSGDYGVNLIKKSEKRCPVCKENSLKKLSRRKVKVKSKIFSNYACTNIDRCGLTFTLRKHSV